MKIKQLLLLFITMIVISSCATQYQSDPTRPDIRHQAKINQQLKLQKMGPMN